MKGDMKPNIEIHNNMSKFMVSGTRPPGVNPSSSGNEHAGIRKVTKPSSKIG